MKPKNQEKRDIQGLHPVDEHGNQVNFGIPLPPDEIYKHREGFRVHTAQQIFQDNPTFIPYRAEYKKGEGNFVYYAGLGDGKRIVLPPPKFPSRCVAPSDAIYAIDEPKRFLVNIVKLLSKLSFSPRKTLDGFLDIFIDTADHKTHRFYLDPEYFCPMSREVMNFVTTFLISLGIDYKKAKEVGEIFASFMEYDNAYRYNVQDAGAETSKEALMEDLPKEYARLLEINRSRQCPIENQSVPDRFARLQPFLKWAWRIPWTKNALLDAIEGLNLDSFKWEEGEIYHTIWYGNYNVQGRPLEERIKLYKQYHGDDESKWPPRVVARPKA